MRVLIVDDEQLARGRIVRMLARIPDVEVVGEAQNGTEARAQVAALTPDVVLLDVEMPGVDGLALAEEPGMPPIVFTTAHPQFAADAFDLDAVDYLVKPVRLERLERALRRARARVPSASAPAVSEAEPHRLAVHGTGSVRFVDARRVSVFRALEKYTAFVLDGEQLLVRDSLDALEARLSPLGFVRAHRAALVRRDAVKEILQQGGAVMVRTHDGEQVEVSRRLVSEVRRQLGVG